MKLAVIGADEESLNLLEWAVARGGHELVAAYDSDAQSSRLRAINSQILVSDNWEELFLGSAADAVIVGRNGKEAAARVNIDPAERRADQLRKLVQAAVPMIVVCPACEAIVGFEIEMIRRDTRGIVLPYVPGLARLASALGQALVSANDSGESLSFEQISVEREQADRSREAVLVRLSRDATLLRQWIGTIQTVTASGSAVPVGRDPLGPKPKMLPSLANLSVTFSGESGLTARWAVGPALAEDLGRLAVIVGRKKVIVTMRASGSWSLDTGDNLSEIDGSTDLDAQDIFERLAAEIATGAEHQGAPWLAACRDQEAAEAVDRSLARGRTIELFNEEHTEEESFKGVMAMGGCLLLVMALGVLFIAVVVEGLRLPMRTWPLWRLWPFYLLVPIVAFLLLQLLQLVVKREETDLGRAMTR
jgi:hypothetical protein